jgi:hypothetical protein
MQYQRSAIPLGTHKETYYSDIGTVRIHVFYQATEPYSELLKSCLVTGKNRS